MLNYFFLPFLVAIIIYQNINLKNSEKNLLFITHVYEQRLAHASDRFDILVVNKEKLSLLEEQVYRQKRTIMALRRSHSYGVKRAYRERLGQLLEARSRFYEASQGLEEGEKVIQFTNEYPRLQRAREKFW